MNVLYFAPFNSRGTYGELSRRYLDSLVRDPSFNVKLLPYPAGDNKIYAGRDDLANIEKRVLKSKEEYEEILNDCVLLWQMPIHNLMYERRVMDGVWPMFARAIEKAKKNINMSVMEYGTGFTTQVHNLLKQYNTKDVIVPYKPTQLADQAAYSRGITLHTITPRTKSVNIPLPMAKIQASLEGKFVVLVAGSWTERNGFDYAITSYLSEFQHQRDVVLVVKTHSYDLSKDELAKTLKDMRGRVRCSAYGEMATADMILLSEHLSDGNMAWLIDRSDVVLHTPMIDGACLLQREAALRGKMVVMSGTPVWDGFVGNVTHCSASTDTAYAQMDAGPESTWNVPRIQSVRTELREAYIRWQKYNDLADAGKEVASRMGKVEWTHEKIAERFKKVVDSAA